MPNMAVKGTRRTQVLLKVDSLFGFVGLVNLCPRRAPYFYVRHRSLRRSDTTPTNYSRSSPAKPGKPELSTIGTSHDPSYAVDLVTHAALLHTGASVCLSQDEPFLAMVRRLLICAAVTFVGLALASCATPRYQKIDFAWTSEHRLSPTESILILEDSIQNTRANLLRWLGQQKAQIVDSDDRFARAFRLHPDAESNFRAMQTITQAEWDAYDRNVVRDWPEGQFARLQQLSASLVTRIQSPATGYQVTVRMNERVATTLTQNSTAAKQFPSIVPGSQLNRA